MRKPLLLHVLALALAGCASGPEHAVFITKTSLALVDLDSTPAGLSFGYQRVEGYIGPRLPDGSVLPVYGFLTTDSAGLGRSLGQVYATGCAAEVVVTGGTPASAAVAPGSACQPTQASNLPQQPVVFLTGTNIGLGLGWGADQQPNINFGYRRKEASLIPVAAGAMPSVLATHRNNVAINAPAPAAGASAARPGADVGITQFFATGRAAVELAQRKEVVSAFRSGAEGALTTLRDADREQLRQSNAVMTCAAAVPDALWPKVWQSAQEQGVLPAAEAARLSTLSLSQARSLHADFASLRLNDQAEHTLSLTRHRHYVCGLAQR
jgi:hypothetical protein